jgi:hypothetical protein
MQSDNPHHCLFPGPPLVSNKYSKSNPRETMAVEERDKEMQ